MPSRKRPARSAPNNGHVSSTDTMRRRVLPSHRPLRLSGCAMGRAWACGNSLASPFRFAARAHAAPSQTPSRHRIAANGVHPLPARTMWETKKVKEHNSRNPRPFRLRPWQHVPSVSVQTQNAFSLFLEQEADYMGLTSLKTKSGSSPGTAVFPGEEGNCQRRQAYGQTAHGESNSRLAG